ncbi:Hypothetical predicted protein [Olea europaea subsp. europaea]|uniref:Uncharacterized protein n=1 Tax=Olea europaea subsp. europaea TaxID=158383 RepID=A0A8S0TC88_OLEEU|nr:Hypothetical predicted protein [Olea europaea subsp. europaea]
MTLKIWIIFFEKRVNATRQLQQIFILQQEVNSCVFSVEAQQLSNILQHSSRQVFQNVHELQTLDLMEFSAMISSRRKVLIMLLLRNLARSCKNLTKITVTINAFSFIFCLNVQGLV